MFVLGIRSFVGAIAGIVLVSLRSPGASVRFLIASTIWLAVVLGLGIETKQRVLEGLSG